MLDGLKPRKEYFDTQATTTCASRSNVKKFGMLSQQKLAKGVEVEAAAWDMSQIYIYYMHVYIYTYISTCISYNNYTIFYTPYGHPCTLKCRKGWFISRMACWGCTVRSYCQFLSVSDPDGEKSAGNKGSVLLPYGDGV